MVQWDKPQAKQHQYSFRSETLSFGNPKLNRQINYIVCISLHVSRLLLHNIYI